MNIHDVTAFYDACTHAGIEVWVDGGWCVDALIGRQTRSHPDLDIAVARHDSTKLKSLLRKQGYVDKHRNDTTEYNYAMSHDGKTVDIHVFEHDSKGNNIYGIEYPKKSLTGHGTLGGREVRCIAPDWMFKFKTAYKPQSKDIQDVKILSEKYGFKIPASHRS